MAVREFAKTFGAAAALGAAQQNANNGDAQQELPKAQLWLNVGYRVDVPTADGKGTETKFVSLPVGIPLDTQKPIDIRVRNQDLADLQAHQNQLLADMVEMFMGHLEPGDETYPTNLEIQIRRVKEPITAPVARADSPFARKANFFEPAVEPEVAPPVAGSKAK